MGDQRLRSGGRAGHATTLKHLLAIGLLALAWLPVAVPAAITPGVPREQVIAKLGNPSGRMTVGGKEILLYPGGLRIELRNGIVEEVNRPPSPSATPTAVPSPSAATASQTERRTAATVVTETVPEPFVPITTRDSELPLLPIAWADSPYTTEMFSVNVMHGKDRPPLHRIAGRGALAKLETALKQGEDVKTVDPVGRTAMHRYPELTLNPHEAVKLMKLLLEHGADLNARDRFGQTPLHVAAQYGYAPVKYLIDAGAELNARDKDGRTPLHLAAAHQNTGGRDLLIAAGADTDVADIDGFTIAKIAREQSRWVSRHKLDGNTKSLSFGNNCFIATGSFTKSILISGDGASWRSVPGPGSGDLATVAFVRDHFVGWATHRGCYGSSDGISWEELDAPNEPTPFEFTAASPERVIAMGMSATVIHSPDGRAWSARSGGVCAYTVGLAWTGDRFAALNRDGIVACSPDGLTWGKVKLNLKGLALKRVRWVNGELFGLGYGGFMIRSTDGVEWEQIPIPATDALNDIAWGQETYVAVGDKGIILISEDGRKWRVRRQAGAGDFQAVAFGNNAFVTLSRGAIWSAYR